MKEVYLWESETGEGTAGGEERQGGAGPALAVTAHPLQRLAAPVPAVWHSSPRPAHPRARPPRLQAAGQGGGLRPPPGTRGQDLHGARSSALDLRVCHLPGLLEQRPHGGGRPPRVPAPRGPEARGRGQGGTLAEPQGSVLAPPPAPTAPAAPTTTGWGPGLSHCPRDLAPTRPRPLQELQLQTSSGPRVPDWGPPIAFGGRGQGTQFKP